MILEELKDLLLVKKATGDMRTEITGLQMDSRKIKKGDLFICISGNDGLLTDRHLYAEEAVKNGAAALIVEKNVEADVPKIFVEDARYAMALIASHFYGYPSNEMRLIGVTGTNGKTTTSSILEKILADHGFRTGLMGNLGVKINGRMYPTDINTPEPPALQKNLRLMREEQTDFCVMEVSSQGLDMGRVLGCHFRTAVFTNLTQDHLDYHGTFEAYKKAKGQFFSGLGMAFSPEDKKYAVLNADDPSFEYFRKQTAAQVITYGIENPADVTARDIRITSGGTRFTLVSFKGVTSITLHLVGRFNIYNALAAIAAALAEDIPLEAIRTSLADLKAVNGRMELLDEGQDYPVLVDYAHTPDALEKVLQALNEFTAGKIFTVFGCGGNRDAAKRPLMGEIAGRYSDHVIITSDNPRFEDPEHILKAIETGLRRSGSFHYERILDRKEAIEKAISLAGSHDIVLIAGKGHETCQILKDRSLPFDDKEVARKAILNREGTRERIKVH